MCDSDPKFNPNLDPNPNSNQGAIFLGRQLFGYPNFVALTPSKMFFVGTNLPIQEKKSSVPI